MFEIKSSLGSLRDGNFAHVLVVLNGIGKVEGVLGASMVSELGVFRCSPYRLLFLEFPSPIRCNSDETSKDATATISS